MTGKELGKLRDEDLEFTQSDLARALNVSFATVNRWENERKPIPVETARLLQCLQAVVAAAKARKIKFDLKELREAVLTTGVAGVVASAASVGLIPAVLTAALAVTAPFAWIGGIAGIGAAAALSFFKKIREVDFLISDPENGQLYAVEVKTRRGTPSKRENFKVWAQPGTGKTHALLSHVMSELGKRKKTMTPAALEARKNAAKKSADARRKKSLQK
jgi:transcriptional regulator with XRE-family HTH domain